MHHELVQMKKQVLAQNVDTPVCSILGISQNVKLFDIAANEKSIDSPDSFSCDKAHQDNAT